MKEKKYVDYLIYAITALYTFFSYIKPISIRINIHLLYLVLMCVLIILKLIQKDFKIKINHIDILWVAYLLYLCINVVFITKYRSNAIQYLMYCIVIYLIYLIITCSKDMNLKGLKLFYIFSGIHVVCIILQVVFTDFIMKLNSVILQSKAYEINAYALTNNYYSGITMQPASAGFFATIFVAITFIKLITQSGIKKKLLIQLMVGIVALLLTQKRSFVLATAIAIIYIYIFYNPKAKKNKIYKGIKIAMISTIIVVIMITFIPATRNVIQRFFNTENVLSGRENFYSDMMEWFFTDVVCGVGIGTADACFSYGGHNIYLQTLAETGIIGFTLLYLTLFVIFIKNLKISKNLISQISKEEHVVLLYSIYMQIILFIYGLSGNPIYDYTFFVIFVIAMALPTVIKRRINNEQKS